ncbi:MAG: outer-membrane lipoprotein carrier protein LolA [Candidatus Cloacimonadaceae bacterium]
MKIKILLITVVFLLGLTALQSVNLDESYGKMLAAYGKLNSWQAEIRQTNYFKDSETTLNSTGNFYYQKGRIAIRYDKPNEQYLLVQDGRVTVYDKSARTAVRTKLTAQVQSLDPVQIIKTYWEGSEKTIVAGKNNQLTITLVPGLDKQVKKLVFNLDSRTGYVNQLSYTDAQDNSVGLSFIKTKFNQKIPDSVWKLPIPPNVKIMEF